MMPLPSTCARITLWRPLSLCLSEARFELVRPGGLPRAALGTLVPVGAPQEGVAGHCVLQNLGRLHRG